MDRTNLYTSRHAKLAASLHLAGLRALMLNPGASLVYLTGLHFHLSERPVVAFFVPHHPPVIVLPELEAAKLKALPFAVQAFPYQEDPTTWINAFRQATQAAQVQNKRVGIEPRNLRVLEMRLLEQAHPGVELVSAEESISALRIFKDDHEVAAMRTAARIAQNALEATLPIIRAGLSERQIAAELTLQLLRHGSDPQLAFSPIVSGGPNSANPHAIPSDRPLAAGDLLVIDWGASADGYLSDVTRAFAIGPVEPEFERIAQIVLAANQAGHAAAGPGVPAGEVDRAARAVIEQTGYGAYFIHRTGHGLGMESHEEPYIRADNALTLEAGMTFTIEPGIYLPDRGGVRIEDDVVITASGCESLTDLPRALRVIAP